MILVFAKYFTTIPQARDAILRGSFYVNGTNVTTPEFQLQPGDVVQMVFNYQHLNYVAGQFMYRSKILDEGIKAITGMRSHSNIKYYGSIRRS